MGGRGHGKGGMSFAAEQLGVGRGEAVPTVAAPLPDYPPLEHRPAPLPPSRSVDEQALRCRTALTAALAGIRLALAPSADAPPPPLDFDWSRFPFELRPTAKRKARPTAISSHRPSKLARAGNIDSLLDKLEKAESVEVKVEPGEEVKGKENEDEDGEEEEGKEEDEEDVDMDDEMDEGTDYNMNYFDNGEEYLDEDDDADDGPIY